VRWYWGLKQRFIVTEMLCRRCVFTALRTVKLGLSNFRYQADPLKCSNKNSYFVPIYSRCWTYAHRPRYVADDTAENDVWAQKLQVIPWWLLLPPKLSVKWNPLYNQHLTATYNDRWIRRGGQMAWPPRSPDLTLKDFFLLGPH
jgi:hypothetical protein